MFEIWGYKGTKNMEILVKERRFLRWVFYNDKIYP